MEKENNNEKISLSKQRKMARKNEIARHKKQSVTNTIIVIGVAVIVLGLIVWGLVSASVKRANTVTPDSNYSAQLEDNGTIKGINVSDTIELPDYNNITVALSEIEYSDEDVDADIEDFLSDNMTVDSSENLVAASGDKVNIDFAGTIDGVAFDGGTAQNQSLELGSHSFIDDFEEQIEGHHPGEEFDVEVTFPEEYSNNEDLAGCDAVFAVKLNGIYVKPEFTDEFVAANLSEYASTVDGYRQYLKDTNYKTNLQTYIQKYLTENSTLKSVPEKYLKQLKANYKAYEYSNFQYMNSLYSSYYGYAPYDTFETYLAQSYGVSEAEYDATLGDKVNDNMKLMLACEAIAEAEGITASVEASKEYFIAVGGTEEDFESMISTYGNGYMAQQYLCEQVINKLYDRVSVK